MTSPGNPELESVHATCVAFDDLGILLRGPSGSGKSDLALRLIEAGAVLVADDRVDLHISGGQVAAAPPPALAGMLEVRGLGLVKLPNLSVTPVSLVCDLVAADALDRLPRTAWCAYLGVQIRCIAAAPFEATAVAKLRIAAYAAGGRPDPLSGAGLIDPGRSGNNRDKSVR